VFVRQGDEPTETIGTNQCRERNGANNVGKRPRRYDRCSDEDFLYLMAFPVFDLTTGMEVIAEEDEEEIVPRALFRSRRKFILGVALISLGLVAAVVGGVCGHGSGQCRRRSHTVSTKAITSSSNAPTPMPLRRSTDVPSRVPSVSSKDFPSTRPSDVVSRQPSALPSVVPAKSPASVIPSVVTVQHPASGGVPSHKFMTHVPTNTKASSSPTTFRARTNGPASAAPSKPMASISAKEECTLFGCYLRNLESRTEIRLSLASPTSYEVRSNGSFASSRYSIRCDASDNVQFIDYYLGGDTFDAPLWFVHREHESPFWMHSNSENWIEPVPWLSECEEDLPAPTIVKTVRVALGTSDDDDEKTPHCREASFQLTVHCNGSRQ
jgi:hypothetical protein